MFKHMLLPTDGTELSERAVLAAIEFATSINAWVTGIHVASSPEQLNRETKAQPKGVLNFVEGTAKDYEVPCECLYVSGDHPFEEIIKMAAERGCDHHLDGVPRTQRYGGAVVGKRDQQGADPHDDSRVGLALNGGSLRANLNGAQRRSADRTSA